ncbi:hypothetical protein L596_028081 [Steinernema carpocapsae]|uniref:RNA helicase n=1 Tax=Steinernema carpocapsae TaxID=34508 RepID=A0A4U5LXE4_STECR|nr:hypothetical protein L596_028081 [Steinernema carpocapsae]
MMSRIGQPPVITRGIQCNVRRSYYPVIYETDTLQFIGEDKPDPTNFFETFDDCGIFPELMANLERLEITQPSALQKATMYLATQRRYHHRNMLIRSDRRGKLLSLLIPVIACIYEWKIKRGFQPEPRRPLALIMVPITPLLNELEVLLTELLRDTPITFACTTMASDETQVRTDLRRGVHILIGIPLCVRNLSLPRRSLPAHELDAIPDLDFSDVEWTIMSHCDVMYMGRFPGPSLARIIEGVRSKSVIYVTCQQPDEGPESVALNTVRQTIVNDNARTPTHLEIVAYDWPPTSP